MNCIRRWIIIPDLQIPFHDEKALSLVEKYMAAHTWDGVLYIGDMLDFDSISNFNKGKGRALEGKRIALDYDMANKILDRHQQMVWNNNPYAKFVLLEGNHEERMERYVDENPQIEGMVEVAVGLKLEHRKFQWIRSWSKGEIFKIGKANFVHGLYTNAYHPAKMATKFGGNIFYGHTHDMMCHAVSNQLDAAKVHVGQSLGCLCLPQGYMKGAPTNWQQGFGIFYFLPDGNFTYYTPRIVNNMFVSPDGVLYL